MQKETVISVVPHFERHEVTKLLELFKQGLCDIEMTTDLLYGCYYLLNLDTNNESENADNYSICLAVICHVSDSRPNDVLVCEMLHECIVSSRVFLYSDMLRNIYPPYAEKTAYSLFDTISQEYYRQPQTETVLTKDQKKLVKFFEQNRRIVVSAPTSFGKSRVIEEIIISNDYKNIFIVLPTIALLNETYLRFKSNKLICDKYDVYNTTNLSAERIEYSKNIFILTPEKTDVILDTFDTIKADFFVIDEIYKIKDRKDDRSQVFVNCLYRLLKFGCNFYLIGPYFDSFSQKFIERTQSKFIKFKSELVQKEVVDIYSIVQKSRYNINNNSITKLSNNNKDGNLKRLINSLKSQSIIYVGKSKEVETRAKYLADLAEGEIENELIGYISENVSSEWSLIKCLQKKVAFHHGAIPRYIQSEVIDLFNLGILQSIVCSTTITEGVNTTAKNVIIFDSKKGLEPLTHFDIKNIKGRAGRFKEHFVGRVYTLTELPAEDIEDNDIGFSYYDEENLRHEELIQIDRAELDGSNLESIKSLESKLKLAGIEMQFIRANKFVSVDGQIELIHHLRENDYVKESILKEGITTSSQLEIIMEFLVGYLFSEQDKEHKFFTLENLIRWIKLRIYNDYSIKQFIADMPLKHIDSKIRNTFKLHRDYFEFRLPKYFTALENVLNYAFNDGNWGGSNRIFNFGYLIAKIEFGSTEEHIICMKEADLPMEIILKIEQDLIDCRTLDMVREELRLFPRILSGLTSFEKKLVSKYI